MELKPRLAVIAAHVKQGTVVVDVGTDHAYLPVYLVQSGKCPSAVGVDVHRGPYLSAVEQVRQQGLEKQIALYLGDGLKPVIPGQADTVVIAGMGGPTMVEILEASPAVLQSVQQLILQPMVAGAALRLWLLLHGWAIADEQLVKEEQRIYEIIVAQRGSQTIPPNVELELGPCIIAKRDPLLQELIEIKVHNLEKILRQIEKSIDPAVAGKRSEVLTRIKELKEVLI